MYGTVMPSDNRYALSAQMAQLKVRLLNKYGRVLNASIAEPRGTRSRGKTDHFPAGFGSVPTGATGERMPGKTRMSSQAVSLPRSMNDDARQNGDAREDLARHVAPRGCTGAGGEPWSHQRARSASEPCT